MALTILSSKGRGGSGSGGPPSGSAGGVLSGNYPNPGFAVDLATQTELDAHINDATDAHDASAVSFAPTGSISATDVQAAIAEVASEATGGTGGWTYTTQSSAYNAVIGDLVTADATGGAFTITLPTAVGQAGKRIGAIRINPGNDRLNVTIATTSSQTINGLTTYLLYSQYEVAVFVSNGANWLLETKRQRGQSVKVVTEPPWGAKNDSTTASGAAIQSAIDSLNTSGTRIGGVVEVPTGDYYIERPIIVPHAVRLAGYAAQGPGTLLRAHSTFPSMTLNNGGVLTLPADNTAFTVTVTAMSANMPVTGGVITLDTSVGYGSVVYTGISGNNFTGCKIKNVGGQTFAGSTVADGTGVGTFMLWMSDPALGTPGGYSNRLENISVDCSTSGASAQAIPHISGVFSNRFQEDAGCYSFKARNYMRFGMHLSQAPQGQFHQDWMIRGLTLSPSSTVTNKCMSFQCDGAASTIRGLDDATFASVGLVEVPATAMRISGSTGHFSRILVEQHEVCCHLTGTGSGGANSGIIISALHGYGGGTSAMTDIVKIDSNHFGSIALMGIRKIAAPSANLVNHHDGTTTRLVTDNSIGHYFVSEENAAGKRSIFTDAPTMASIAANGMAMKVKAGIPSDADFTVVPDSGTLVVDTTNSKLYVRVGSTWKSVTVA